MNLYANSSILFIKTTKFLSPKSHSKTNSSLSLLVFFAMTRTPYYHFIPLKGELVRGEGSGNFPLHPTRYDLVDIRNETPTLLNLYDQWEIKKVLTALDVGSLGALVLDQEQIFNHIFKYWARDLVMGMLRRGEQNPIVIRDLDTKTEYNSFLKKSTIDESCFVISTGWTRDFVYRRDLMEGDTVGLYWHPQSKSFCFSVLNRVGDTTA